MVRQLGETSKLNKMELIPIQTMQAMAEALAKSRLFGLQTPEQALALGLLCQAEGLHPAVAARDYHIIQGRASLKSDAMLSRFQSAGGKVAWSKYTDDAVSATFSHPSGGSVEIEWTLERAKKAGLAGKDTWKAYPRQMLKARVISEGIRMILPGVVSGLYAPEEVGEFEAMPETFNDEQARFAIESAQTLDELQAKFADVWKAAKNAGATKEQLQTLLEIKDSKKHEIHLHTSGQTN